MWYMYNTPGSYFSYYRLQKLRVNLVKTYLLV